jgi:nucleoid-associated protein YgaU
MRITKLHLILFVAAAVCAVFFALQYQQEKIKRAAVIEEQNRKADEDARARVEIDKKSQSASKAIAVAGEYWLKGRKEGREISAGQAILHKAKESLGLNKFGEAEALARQSIEEFKKAELTTIKYTVKRRDNLWKIAKMKQHYGRGSMWPVIWRANEKKIPDFDVLRVRLVLAIPKSESEINKYTRHKRI